MKLDKSSDTSNWTHVYPISNEIEPVFEQLGEMYRDVDLKIFTVFRCLPDEYKRRTFRRYEKKDNVLCLDINVSEDKYTKLNKEEQLSFARRSDG